MSIDVAALVRLLREDPEQREALRAALLGDEADLTAALARLADAEARVGQRLEALAEAQGRTEARVDALAMRLGELAEAQQRTENAVNALLDVVSGMTDRLAKLDGHVLEQRYRERGHGYFQRLARRLRHLDGATLSALVDDAQDAGTISTVEAGSLLQADAVFAGQNHETREPLHLAVEASVTIARHDVRRARERAGTLARVVATPVLAVVAGEYAPEPVRVAAADADVWVVTDGRVIGPFDDPEDPV